MYSKTILAAAASTPRAFPSEADVLFGAVRQDGLRKQPSYSATCRVLYPGTPKVWYYQSSHYPSEYPGRE